MPRKPSISRYGDNWAIKPSLANPDLYFWSVYSNRNTVLVNNRNTVLVNGYTSTYEHAFRAVRNYIKNNQELVYGSNKAAA